MALKIEQLPLVTRALQALLAAGEIPADEAEAALLAALEAATPAEVGRETARRVALMEDGRREQIQAAIQDLVDFSQDRLARAREALLAIPDSEWQAAGGTPDE